MGETVHLSYLTDRTWMLCSSLPFPVLGGHRRRPRGTIVDSLLDTHTHIDKIHDGELSTGRTLLAWYPPVQKRLEILMKGVVYLDKTYH